MSSSRARAVALVLALLAVSACHGSPTTSPTPSVTPPTTASATATTTAPAGPTPSPRPASARPSTPPPTPAPSRPATTSPPPTGSRWVAVSVATLWVRPGETRAVDLPALGNPADPRGWVAGMSVADKRWLVGRVETQALYGTRVVLLATSGAWSKVAVADQPTPRNPAGYPGWLPTVQLTTQAPARTASYAVVRSPTAWVYRSAATLGAAAGRVVELSYDTRLPVARVTPAYVEVVWLSGEHRVLRRSDVVLHGAGAPWSSTGAQAVAEAKKFLGLGYLWGGTSGFGFDCSGLTYAVHHALGTTISRDADQQALHGSVVARTALQPGDLVFFQTAQGFVHHVGMYAGGGAMVESPATGLAVRVTSLSAEPYAGEYAGARRYLPG